MSERLAGRRRDWAELRRAGLGSCLIADLHFGVDMAVTAGFSLVIHFFALSRRLPDAVARERLRSGVDELKADAAPADGQEAERETEGARAREPTPVAR